MVTTTSRTRENDVLRHAASRFHVLSVEELYDLQCDGSWIWRRRRNGFLVDILPTVVAVAIDPHDLPRDAWARAATLRPRNGAALSHESAATRHGIWDRGSDERIDVTTTGRGGVSRPALAAPALDIVTHRTTCPPGASIVDRVRTTDVLRTLLDVGVTNRPLQITAMIREAVYRHRLDVDQLQDALAAQPRRAGLAAVRQALGWFHERSAGTRSRSEDQLVSLIEDSELPFPKVNVLGATGHPDLEVDFVWPDARYAIEVDGAHHTALPGFAQRDRERDARLRADGWIVDRVPHLDVWRQPDAVVCTIRRRLGYA